jgi:hypothetical protein
VARAWGLSGEASPRRPGAAEANRRVAARGRRCRSCSAGGHSRGCRACGRSFCTTYKHTRTCARRPPAPRAAALALAAATSASSAASRERGPVGESARHLRRTGTLAAAAHRRPASPAPRLTAAPPHRRPALTAAPPHRRPALTAAPPSPPPSPPPRLTAAEDQAPVQVHLAVSFNPVK